MRASLAAGVSLLLVITACSPLDTGEGVTTTVPEIVVTTAPTTTLPLVAGCPESGDFVEGGEIGVIDQSPSDSTTVGAIRWDETESCETFSISFVSSEGAPATTPPSVEASYVAGVPVVRIATDADSTVITDQLVETALVSRLYVVRALDGGMFIDLHLAAPAQARIEVSSSPATLTLHLQPGIVEYVTGPAISDLVVIAAPLDGAAVPTSVDVAGYSRTFEAKVLVIATAGNEVLAQTFTSAADWLETWGEFTVTLELPPGEASLFVGDESPEDGSLEGITLRLTVR